MLLQAGGDPLLKPVWDVLKDERADDSIVKTFSVIRTYWDQNHGWCGAGGDRKGDPRTREAVVGVTFYDCQHTTSLLVI